MITPSPFTRSSRTKLALAVALATTASYTIGVAPFAQSRGEVQVRVDMEVTAGRLIAVFVNDLALAPAMAAPELGVRRVYSFTFTREDIVLLRLDPTDAAQTTIKLYGVEVADQGRTIVRWTPGELRRWAGVGFTIVDDPSALVMKTVTNDPMIVTWERISLGGSGTWLQVVRRVLLNRPHVLPFLLLPVLILAGRGSRLVHVVVLGAVILLVPWITREVHGWVVGREALGGAVSRAMFLGQSVRGNQLVALLVFCVAVTLGIGAAFLTRLAGRDAGQPPVPIGSDRSRWWLMAWWIALALIYLPDLAGTLSGIGLLNYVPHWDHDLFTYWADVVNDGSLPFRDYWYPYGGQFLFDLPWPWGPIARWCFDVLLFGTLSTSLWLLAPERRLGALAVVAAIVIAERIGLVFTLNRYLLAPNLVLAYLATARAPRITPARLVLAGLTIALTLVFEPVQVLAAMMVIATLWLVDTILRRPGTIDAVRESLRTPLIFASVGLGVVVLAVAALAWSGQLRGAAAFYRGMSMQYAAFPTPLGDLSWRVFDLRLAVLWWPSAAVAIGLHERLSARTSRDSLRGSAVLAIGLVAFVVLQKHLMRPMDLQLLIYPLLGGLLYALFTPRPVSGATAVALGGAIGLLGALVVVQGHSHTILTMISEAPRRLAGFVSVAFDPSLSAKANRERFSSDRFVRYPGERELVTVLDRRAPGPLTLFALTDAPVLYILTGQKPLWVSNMYDAAPVTEQRRTVQWLRRTHPEFVVFEAGQLQFDSVPTAVRVPLVLEEIIETYVPDSRVGRFEVLRSRRPGEAISIDYWRGQLGAVLDLGHLPAVIDVVGRAPCSVPAPCDEYAVAEVQAPRNHGEQTMTLQVDGRSMDIRFDLEAGRTHYVIPLSRLWMWKVAEAGGARPVVGSSDGASHVQLIKLAPDDSRLY